MTKRNLNKLVKELASATVAILANVADATSKHVQYVGEQYVAFGIVIDEYRELATAHGLTEWREWARERFSANGRVSVSVDTLYRIQNAGAVARACEGIDLDGVTYLALVPFYRALAAAKTDEEKTQARTLVRELVTQGVESDDGLTVDTAEKLTVSIAPTRGKGAGNAKQTATNRNAAKKRRAARTATAPPEITPEDSAAREACSNAIGRILGKIGEDDRPMARTLMVATAKLCETYSPTTVQALVKSWKATA